MKYKIERLYNEYASVRDYVVEECVQKMRDLVLEYNGKRMTLSPQDLINRRVQFSPRKFKSKFGGLSYMLYDYRFVPDEPKQKKGQAVKPAPETQLDLFTS